MEPNDLINKLIGLTKGAALALIAENGLLSRIVSEDGSNPMLDCQYFGSRINLTVVAGKITHAGVG